MSISRWMKRLKAKRDGRAILNIDPVTCAKCGHRTGTPKLGPDQGLVMDMETLRIGREKGSELLLICGNPECGSKMAVPFDDERVHVRYLSPGESLRSAP